MLISKLVISYWNYSIGNILELCMAAYVAVQSRTFRNMRRWQEGALTYS